MTQERAPRIIQDRRGDQFELREEASGSGVRLSLLLQSPSLEREHEAGWLNLGGLRSGAHAEIIDMRISEGFRRSGLGSTLVRTAIEVARRSGCSRVYGHVIKRDFDYQPFLPDWYEGLGFIVERIDDEWAKAVFWMDLAPQDDADASPMI